MRADINDDIEDGGFFGLVDAVIEFRKNNPQPEYISPEIKERNRILDFIEAEIKYYNSASCFESAGVLTDLLTKLKEIK